MFKELREGNWVEALETEDSWSPMKVNRDNLVAVEMLPHRFRPIKMDWEMLSRIEGIRFSQEPHRVYDPKGDWLVSIRDGKCLVGFKASVFEIDELHRVQNAVQAITGKEISLSYEQE